MAGGLAAPATVGWTVWREEETASEMNGRCQDGIEVFVDATERENVEEDARVHASFGRSWIFPF